MNFLSADQVVTCCIELIRGTESQGGIDFIWNIWLKHDIANYAEESTMEHDWNRETRTTGHIWQPSNQLNTA